MANVRKQKNPPLNWFHNQLNQFCPGNSVGLVEYVLMDQGGESFCNPKVMKIFEKRGFKINPTGTDASHQNGPVECDHCTVTKGI